MTENYKVKDTIVAVSLSGLSSTSDSSILHVANFWSTGNFVQWRFDTHKAIIFQARDIFVTRVNKSKAGVAALVKMTGHVFQRVLKTYSKNIVQLEMWYQCDADPCNAAGDKKMNCFGHYGDLKRFETNATKIVGRSTYMFVHKTKTVRRKLKFAHYVVKQSCVLVTSTTPGTPQPKELNLSKTFLPCPQSLLHT